MRIHERITSALHDLNVPVSFQTYQGNAKTYVTFFQYMEQPSLHQDDAIGLSVHYIQIDLWSNGDYLDLDALIQTKMEKAGFRFLTGYDQYEQDVKMYHKSLRYAFEEEGASWHK
ncbi:hypothetical protein [Salisediminibacterium selenitireducens]|uniref:Uncharacterized protein n=1 Tax=Bacillus selenitireducens (strain ATCC 700615 / DSM 15326 / MLS10) TaxID=439292 RepID=D6XZY0_BACIE|nr:hypothetical protein [Salisediminibacterium selenitireducens]ADI00482.1 hypothetical protein Bsel_3000 [[Bacillus] selenitireducens MLS10]